MLDIGFVHELKERVFAYMRGFYCDDSRKNAHYRLKEIHTYYVYMAISDIAHELDLPMHQRLVSKLLGLLHDVGRFEQFKKYDTFNDSQSINHSCFGAKMIEELGFLEGLDKDDADAILTAVRYHGVRDIPADLPDEQKFYLRMIRDADKLDIFRVTAEKYIAYLRDPKAFRIEMNIPEEGKCNPVFLKALLNNELLDYEKMESMEDMKLLQLGWVYDLNFEPTMRKIKARRYLEMLIDLLPREEEIMAVCRHILEELDRRIEQKRTQAV